MNPVTINALRYIFSKIAATAAATTVGASMYSAYRYYQQTGLAPNGVSFKVGDRLLNVQISIERDGNADFNIALRRIRERVGL